VSGSQRYKCQHCQRVYTPQPEAQGYPESVRLQAVRMYVDGLNFRRIGRQLKVNHQTVINWVNAYEASLATPLPSQDNPETAELDELFSFIGHKKTGSTS
jgi:transposase